MTGERMKRKILDGKQPGKETAAMPGSGLPRADSMDGAPTLRRLYREGAEALGAAGIREADLDAWRLLEYATGTDKAHYYGDPLKTVEKGQVMAYRKLLEKRGQRIPLQHLTGCQEFMGLPFFVNRQVLIPRQDTEVLAEEALSRMRAGDRVLDLCTGSGCILLSLLKLGPKAWGTGADQMEGALAVAEENARRLGASASFIKSDLFAGIADDQKFDMIVSNPPYIPTGEIGLLEDEVRLHEPREALDGGEDGLSFYRKIPPECAHRLKPGGWLLMEIGCGQAKQAVCLMQKAGFKDVLVKKDLAGLDRVVVGRL